MVLLDLLAIYELACLSRKARRAATSTLLQQTHLHHTWEAALFFYENLKYFTVSAQ